MAERRGTKTCKVTVYMTEDEEAELTRRAAQLGQTLARFLVECGMRESMQKPIDRELISLSEELTEARVLAKQAHDRLDVLEAWAQMNGFAPGQGGLAERLAG